MEVEGRMGFSLIDYIVHVEFWCSKSASQVHRVKCLLTLVYRRFFSRVYRSK